MNCCAILSAGSSRKPSGVRTVNNGPHPQPPRRWRQTAGWIVPSGILALLPKCPACIVAYFAIAGGIGISLSTAVYLRMALVVLCVGLLLYFAARWARRQFTARLIPEPEAPKCPSTKILSSPLRSSIELNSFKTLRKYFSKNVTVAHLNVI